MIACFIHIFSHFQNMIVQYPYKNLLSNTYRYEKF